MGKKNKKNRKSSNDFDRDLLYGGGKARDMLDRYGVEGYNHGRTDRGGEYRGIDEVKKDLANAMMNDYDTRRTMESAAMAGNKDAKKFAKKGFKAGNLYAAHDVMRDLKKEYVGGGGMNGAENRAGLTYAAVKADRDNFQSSLDEKYDAKYASQKALEEMQEKIKRDSLQPTAGAPELSQAMQEANDGINKYDDDMSSFGDMLKGASDDVGQAEAEATMETAGSSDAAQSFKDEYSSNVKGGLKLSGIETRGPRSGVRPGEGF